jgi:hypothetical protein
MDMSQRPNEQWFLEMRRDASAAQDLYARTCHVLGMRQLASFDGLGHFLDEVLPDDPQRLGRIAVAIHMSAETLSRLRASRLDPLSLEPGPLALLWCALGLQGEQFEGLVLQDHHRFLPQSRGMAVRGESEETSMALNRLRTCLTRTAEDRGTDL